MNEISSGTEGQFPCPKELSEPVESGHEYVFNNSFPLFNFLTIYWFYVKKTWQITKCYTLLLAPFYRVYVYFNDSSNLSTMPNDAHFAL